MTVMSFRGRDAAYLMPALREVEVKRMKGTNEMTLNEETMIEAVQEWLDKRWSDPRPIVKSVKPEKSEQGVTYDGKSTAFVVVLEATDKAGAKPAACGPSLYVNP